MGQSNRLSLSGRLPAAFQVRMRVNNSWGAGGSRRRANINTALTLGRQTRVPAERRDSIKGGAGCLIPVLFPLLLQLSRGHARKGGYCGGGGIIKINEEHVCKFDNSNYREGER